MAYFQHQTVQTSSTKQFIIYRNSGIRLNWAQHETCKAKWQLRDSYVKLWYRICASAARKQHFGF